MKPLRARIADLEHAVADIRASMPKVCAACGRVGQSHQIVSDVEDVCDVCGPSHWIVLPPAAAGQLTREVQHG